MDYTDGIANLYKMMLDLEELVAVRHDRVAARPSPICKIKSIEVRAAAARCHNELKVVEDVLEGVS